MVEPGLVVVGSGPGGLAAVTAFRELDRQTPVVLVTSDLYPPYARPPLTKDFLRGDVELDDLWLTETGWFSEQRIELRLGVTVTGLDRERRRVTLSDRTTIDYRDLVLATGAHPTPLPVPGGDDPELLSVRTLVHGHRLRELIRQTERVAVIGSGFIGCEVAASLAHGGVEVVLITGEEQPHAERLGADAGREIERWLTEVGVELLLGARLTRITREADGFLLERGDAGSVRAAAVVVAGGAKPDLELIEAAGLPVAEGGVAVDASLRTPDPHVFAVGDLAYAEHRVAGRALRVEHWGDAETHGKVAGTVAAGGAASWGDPPGFWSSIGDRTLKYTAWGDGHDEAVFVGDADRWSVWYRRGPELVGVLTHEDDDAYERAQELLARRADFDEALSRPDGPPARPRPAAEPGSAG